VYIKGDPVTDYSNYKGRLFLVNPNRFIFSKINAKRGCIYYSPENQNPFAVSSEYPVLKLDTKQILGDYFNLAMRVGPAREGLVGSAAGMAKARTNLADFKNIQIPLLSLAEQKAIVDRKRKAQDKIVAAFLRVDELANGIQQRFLEYLGLKLLQEQEKLKGFAMFWKDFERWGVRYNQQALAGLNLAMGKYPTVFLRDAIADLENGWSPQCLNRPAEDEEWGVLKLGAVSFGLFNDRENKALPKHLKPHPMLEVKKGQVLISRANIPRLVGACAIVSETRPRLMLCDKIFRVVFCADSAIEAEYLDEVMKLPQVRHQIEAAATGTSATMQNITKPSLLALNLPLPPLLVQRQILQDIVASRAEIARERVAVNRIAREINAEIEALILGTKKVSEL